LFEQNSVGNDNLPRYVSAGLTHVGNVRASNQDSLARRDDVGIWAVADGMGGYRQGDVASRMVCQSLLEMQPGATLEESVEIVNARLQEVNRRLFRASTRLINPIMSGTTVVVLLARGDDSAFVWAGDSRLYRLRDGEFAQLTTDHTVAAELNLQGVAPSEADHAITRAVGGDRLLALDRRYDQVRPGDRYLLCSDGLTHELDDAHIAALLAQGTSDEAAQALIAATLEAGARDNVTAIVVDVRR
jgi:type VI secretion system protein ImpM